MILLNDQKIEIKRFPNGEARIEKQQFSLATMGTTRRDLTIQYRSDTDLFDLLLVRKALWFPVNLHIPYFPYSRMDRKSDSHVFTLKSVAKYINWLDFNKVFIYEPHSDVTPALLNKCTIVPLIPKLLASTDFNKEQDCVLYPDSSAYKHYSDLIKSPNELIGIKKRDFATGRIKDLTIIGDPLIHGEELAGCRVFIIDDLCSKGGTFVLAAQKLEKMGAGEIYLVVAHCEEAIFDGDIFDYIDRVYTTNTIIKPQSNGENISIASYNDLTKIA